MRRVLTILLLVAATLVIPSTAEARVPKPNIVLVVSDDQRWDTIDQMPVVQSELVAKGASFTHAHVVTPVCCPSRASILTGDYAHTTKVWGNNPPLGGVGAFDDSETIATLMQSAGYKTGLFGKYMNGYGEQTAPDYTPPGWDEWHAITSAGKYYYDYALSENGFVVGYGHEPADYLTDVLFEKAGDFIGKQMDRGTPFFAMVTPVAPHENAVPEQEYEHAYDDLARWRPPSYNERGFVDKPRWLQKVPMLEVDQRQDIDDLRERQYETLQSVDEDYGQLIRQITQAGQLENTVFIYMSDNGYFWGEHRLVGKNRPYQEATRVPLIFRWDGSVMVNSSPKLAANIDISPTIADVAGVPLDADGSSLLPYMRGAERFPRNQHLIESIGSGTGIGPWCMLQGQHYTFTHYATGEEEYYDLRQDQYQLKNAVSTQTREHLRDLRADLRALCDPLPPGMEPW